MSRPLHVVEIADSRFPIAEPFAGGMQALTWHLIEGLRRRGVALSVFAGPGSDPRLGASLITSRPAELSAAARQDVSMRPEEWVQQHHAYLQVMLGLAAPSGHRRGAQQQPALPAGRDGRDVGRAGRDHAAHAAHALAGARRSGWPTRAAPASPPSAGTPPTRGRTWPTPWSSRTVWTPTAGRTASGGPDLVWSGRIAPEKAPAPRHRHRPGSGAPDPDGRPRLRPGLLGDA